jgi:hypothetical protein
MSADDADQPVRGRGDWAVEIQDRRGAKVGLIRAAIGEDALYVIGEGARLGDHLDGVVGMWEFDHRQVSIGALAGCLGRVRSTAQTSADDDEAMFRFRSGIRRDAGVSSDGRARRLGDAGQASAQSQQLSA